MADTHSVMPKSLAMELIKAGVQHFDGGGILGSLSRAITPLNGYNAQLAPTTQSDYQPGMQAGLGSVTQGMAQGQNIQGQQQALANTLLAQSQGQGPNPAQAALAQQTGNNVQQQAALMASQRGAGANPGLMARQAAMQGGAIQQQAAGQSAALQAQQQLAAQAALQQQQATMGGQNIAQQGIGTQLYGTAGGLQNAQNQGNIANYGMAQGINAQIAAANAKAEQGTAGGILGALGSIGGKFLGLAGGGAAAADPTAGLSSVPQFTMPSFGGFAQGGQVPEHLMKMAQIYHGPLLQGMQNFKAGGPVPGEAEVKGDSKENDTVPALLSPGEAVLPRSVTQSANAPEKAAEFMRHLMKMKEKQGGYASVVAQKKAVKK